MSGQRGSGQRMSDWRIGETVAWSTAWSRENAFALRPSRDFPGMTEVSQVDRQGQGEPLFAAVHVDRQRRGLADHLCHVCGRPAPEDDRWMFPVAAGDFVPLHDGRIGFGCNVPPLHRACADTAAALCPHLLRLAESPSRWPAGPTRLIWRTDVVPGMEALAATFPPGLEIVYACYRLFDAEAVDAIRGFREAWERETRRRRRQGNAAG